MRVVAAAFFAFLVCFPGVAGVQAVEPSPRGPYRILHVMSYGAAGEWNREQFQGFADAIKDVAVSYRFVELDPQQTGDEETLRKAADAAAQVIDDWRPDLVYANDDRAQQYVTRRFLGSPVPFVYSAVNTDPAAYGFPAANVTGVLEHEHFEATVALLRRLVPGVRRIAVIFDQDPTWTGVLERIRLALPSVPDLQVVDWAEVRSFDEYKQRIVAYQTMVDAFAPLGSFNFKEADGKVVDFHEVMRWTVENSRIPDFSFWDIAVEGGTLVAVTVSGYEQGFLAGQMARQILVDGIPPAAIPVRSSRKGRPAINLARARRLGIGIDSATLLMARVSPGFSWERR